MRGKDGSAIERFSIAFVLMIISGDEDESSSSLKKDPGISTPGAIVSRICDGEISTANFSSSLDMWRIRIKEQLKSRAPMFYSFVGGLEYTAHRSEWRLFDQ